MPRLLHALAKFDFTLEVFDLIRVNTEHILLKSDSDNSCNEEDVKSDIEAPKNGIEARQNDIDAQQNGIEGQQNGTDSRKPDIEARKIGKFTVITSACTRCASRFTPKGLSPGAHLGDGLLDLIFVSKTSRLNYFRYILLNTSISTSSYVITTLGVKISYTFG